MKTEEAVARLSALAQETRLELFRRLVRRGPPGLAAGALAEALAVPAPTLSFHLATLERTGLVVSRREGRSIVYSASYPAMEELLAYLLENCCADGACAPPAPLIAPPRAKKATKKR
jgi:DNA-binding transcriptional ArsR family regulator